MKRYQSLLLLVCALALTCGCKKSDPNATAPDGAQIADQHNYDLAEPIKIPELQTEQEYRSGFPRKQRDRRRQIRRRLVSSMPSARP